MPAWHGGDKTQCALYKPSPQLQPEVQRENGMLWRDQPYTEDTTTERAFESDTRNLEEARQELYPLHARAALKGWKASMARA